MIPIQIFVERGIQGDTILSKILDVCVFCSQTFNTFDAAPSLVCVGDVILQPAFVPSFRDHLRLHTLEAYYMPPVT